MTNKNKLLLIPTFAGLLLTACSLEKEVSRVEIPNSKIAIVLTEDGKQMFRYHVLMADKPVGDPRFLGPHNGDANSYKPTITSAGRLVTVTWKGAPSTLTAPFVQVDLAARQISDSQIAQKLPPCA
jgi:hypothetical protein